jgi:hypothetical protein
MDCRRTSVSGGHAKEWKRGSIAIVNCIGSERQRRTSRFVVTERSTSTSTSTWIGTLQVRQARVIGTDATEAEGSRYG